MQALDLLPGGEGKVIAVRLWELQAMKEWGLQESDWAKLPVMERARYVCAVKLPQWLESLDIHKQSLELNNGR